MPRGRLQLDAMSHDSAPRHHLRHDAARRRAGARLLDATCRRSWRWRARSTRSASTSSRPGFPIASPADAEAVRQIAARGAAAGHRRAGPLPRRRTSRRPARALEPAERRAHPHVHRHLRPAPRAQAAHDARGVPRGGRRRRPAAPASSPTTWSSRRRTRRAATATSCAASIEAVDRRRAPRRSTCRTRSATPRPTRSREFFARSSGARARTPTRRSSARTATTISAWRSPTASRPFRAARGRSSARSTASASAPATRRSKRSSWRCASAHDRLPLRHRRSDPQQLFATSQLLTRSPASRCRRTRRSSAATPSRTKPASTRTAC